MATCSRSFTLNVTEVDTPLDQAVYANSTVAGGAFIYAVRGGYIFKFNASTGVRISLSRFIAPCFGMCSIAYESVTDRLFVTVWNEMQDWITTPPPPAPPSKGLFRINPSSLAVENQYDLGVELTWAGNPLWADGAYAADGGPRRIVAYNGFIYGIVIHGTWTQGMFRFNASTNAFNWQSGTSFSADGMGALAVDAGGAIFISHDDTWHIYNIDLTVPASGFNARGIFPTPYGTSQLAGLCLKPSDETIYLATRSQTVYHTATDLQSATSFALGDSDAMPYNIRYNSVDGMIYCPGYGNNKVYVIDPTSDTVTATKTGFDSPFDVVFTPTKKWAVQHGSAGLKEIT